MSGAEIQSRIKAGLARAVARTGGNPAQLVLKIEKTGAGGTPQNPTPVTKVSVPLVDAVVSSYTDSNLDQSLIESGDRKLICGPDVAIYQNDAIKVDDEEFIVVGVDVKNPAGVVLMYIAQIRSVSNAT